MKINLLNLKNSITNLSLRVDNNYLLSYPHFVNYFKQKEKLSEQDLICGAFMIYGWMPTILKEIKYTNLTIELFDRAKNNNVVLSEIELNEMKSFTNNSMVGLSKLLHFINPEVYPIWDSKICKYFYSNSFAHQVNNVSNYLNYTKAVNDAIQSGLPEEFETIRNQLTYPISNIRLVEMIIFHTVGSINMGGD